MVNPKKKLKDYLHQSVRKLKHRKGYGVHSPFAYSVITEVIEEKLPYYAYRRMQRTFDKEAPIPFKVACLLLRLANRFGCRNVVELGCDGGYSILPLILTDSRLRVTSVAAPAAQQQVFDRLSWLPNHLQQITFLEQLEAIDEAATFDMVVINNLTIDPQQCISWLLAHSRPDTLIFVRGIQLHQPNEVLWDAICDRDDISVTMDLYNYGLAILRPDFFKQHYVVAF